MRGISVRLFFVCFFFMFLKKVEAFCQTMVFEKSQTLAPLVVLLFFFTLSYSYNIFLTKRCSILFKMPMFRHWTTGKGIGSFYGVSVFLCNVSAVGLFKSSLLLIKNVWVVLVWV